MSSFAVRACNVVSLSMLEVAILTTNCRFFQVPYDDGPLICFNGAKSWYLGWYSDKHVAITQAMLPWRGKLVGIDDYLSGQITEADNYVIANIGDLSVDLFIMYNRQEGVNSGLRANGQDPGILSDGNRVTITNQTAFIAKSRQLGSLDENSEEDFRRGNWAGTGNDLVIQVCKQQLGTPDYAKMLIYLDDGSGAPDCDVPETASPTPAPSRSPTPRPTPVPTPKPRYIR